jgi:hypothetical protein
MFLNNRKSRRLLAKQMGFIEKQNYLTPEDIANGVTRLQKNLKRFERSQAAGEQIHLQHLEMIYSEQAKAKEELETRILNSRADFYIKSGMSAEEAQAKATMDRKAERELEEKKAEKKRKKSTKRI